MSRIETTIPLAIEKDIKTIDNLVIPNIIKKQLEQQKEFIEWLKDEINFYKNLMGDARETGLGNNDWVGYSMWYHSSKEAERVLLKYKEIIGDDENENRN